MSYHQTKTAVRLSRARGNSSATRARCKVRAFRKSSFLQASVRSAIRNRLNLSKIASRRLPDRNQRSDRRKSPSPLLKCAKATRSVSRSRSAARACTTFWISSSTSRFRARATSADFRPKRLTIWAISPSASTSTPFSQRHPMRI